MAGNETTTATAGDHRSRIDRFTHVGIAVYDLDASVDRWCTQFGLEVLHRIDVEVEGLRTAFLASPSDASGFGVELIAALDPTDGSNQVVRHLARRGEGLFHLAATVADVDAAAMALSEQEVDTVPAPPAAIGDGLVKVVDPSASRLIVPPRAANGVLVELLQARS